MAIHLQCKTKDWGHIQQDRTSWWYQQSDRPMVVINSLEWQGVNFIPLDETDA